MLKVRNSINTLYKNVKKHPYKKVLLFLITALFFGITIYRFSPLIISTIFPRNYAEEMRKRDEAARAIKAERRATANAPYVFKKMDLAPLVERYHFAINNLSSHILEPVECLVNSYTNEISPTVIISSERISDKNVISYANEINNYAFSDESVYEDIDGSIKIANKGEKSKHTVTFESVCKLSDVYFFVFNSFGEKTHIGGGGSAPSHFAFSDSSENLTILEKLEGKYIELPKEIDSSLTTTSGGAYYGCRQIYAANDSEVLYRCGSGDGPTQTGSLFLLNLGSKTSVEKVYCEYSAASKYKTLCFDEKGQVYYQESN